MVTNVLLITAILTIAISAFRSFKDRDFEVAEFQLILIIVMVYWIFHIRSYYDLFITQALFCIWLIQTALLCKVFRKNSSYKYYIIWVFICPMIVFTVSFLNVATLIWKIWTIINIIFSLIIFGLTLKLKSLFIKLQFFIFSLVFLVTNAAYYLELKEVVESGNHLTSSWVWWVQNMLESISMYIFFKRIKNNRRQYL